MSTALITGASSGIGLELAKIHAEKGDDLVLVARNQTQLESLRDALLEQYSINIHLIIQDLSVVNAAANVFENTQAQGIVIDYLINNAGFGDHNLFMDMDWQKAQSMIQLNVAALCELSYLYLPLMQKKASGKIMNIASIVAFQPSPLMAVYGASKAFVLNFSEALANEVATHGISVTTFCPGPTKSGFQSIANMAESEQVKGKSYVSAHSAAKAAYHAMMKNQTVIVHGCSNRVLIKLSRLLPRNWVIKISRHLIAKAK